MTLCRGAPVCAPEPWPRGIVADLLIVLDFGWSLPPPQSGCPTGDPGPLPVLIWNIFLQ